MTFKKEERKLLKFSRVVASTSLYPLFICTVYILSSYIFLFILFFYLPFCCISNLISIFFLGYYGNIQHMKFEKQTSKSYD